MYDGGYSLEDRGWCSVGGLFVEVCVDVFWVNCGDLDVCGKGIKLLMEFFDVENVCKFVLFIVSYGGFIFECGIFKYDVFFWSEFSVFVRGYVDDVNGIFGWVGGGGGKEGE